MNRQPSAVWITGTGAGLGRALAQAFLDDGWAVIGSPRRRRNHAETGDRYREIPLDVRLPAAVRKAWGEIRRTRLDVDVLVNNAGVTSFTDFEHTSETVFRTVIDTNLYGMFLATRAVLPSMKRRRKGIIINVLSYAAKSIYTKSSAYAASKAGADMMMRVLREEVRPFGVKVVNVFPGAIDTPMWSRAMRRRNGAKMMPPAEVARAIVGLVTSHNSIVPEELILRPIVGDLTV